MPLSRHLELGSLSLQTLFLGDLLSARLTLTLFDRTFGAESVDLRLTVSSLLLHLPQAGDLFFLLLLDAALLKGLGNFTLNLLFVVTDDLLLFVEILLSQFRLLLQRYLIRGLNFGDQSHVAGAFLFSGLDLSQALVLDLASHLLLLLDQLFALFDALNLSLLNLVHNNEGALSTSLLSDSLALLSNFQALEPLDLHHEVEFALLLKPLLLELLVLFELLVADRYNFRIQDHLVHVLDVVQLFIELSLSFAEDTDVLVALRLLDVSRGHLCSTLLIHGLHALFASFGLF